jgi:hypothetical protein
MFFEGPADQTGIGGIVLDQKDPRVFSTGSLFPTAL